MERRKRSQEGGEPRRSKRAKGGGESNSSTRPADSSPRQIAPVHYPKAEAKTRKDMEKIYASASALGTDAACSGAAVFTLSSSCHRTLRDFHELITRRVEGKSGPVGWGEEVDPRTRCYGLPPRVTDGLTGKEFLESAGVRFTMREYEGDAERVAKDMASNFEACHGKQPNGEQWKCSESAWPCARWTVKYPQQRERVEARSCSPRQR